MMALPKLISSKRAGRTLVTSPVVALALSALIAGCAGEDDEVIYDLDWPTGPSDHDKGQLGPGPVIGQGPSDTPDDPGMDSWLDAHTKAELYALLYGADESIERSEAFAHDVRSMVLHDSDGQLSALAQGVGAVNIVEAELAALEYAVAAAENARAAASGGPTSSAVITGTTGDDILDGGDENDNINGLEGTDTLNGNGGNDYLTGGIGADTINGGDGFDTVAYVISAEGVNVNLAGGPGSGGDAEGDTVSGVEVVRGSPYIDVLTGDGGNNQLYGADGDDTLAGGGGNDFLVGGAGGDTLNGGDGVDYVSYSGSTVGVGVDLTDSGSDGNAEGDTYTDIENIRGSDFNDNLTGDEFSNIILGSAGSDIMSGGGGDDSFIGGPGGDTHVGGAGEDWALWIASPAGVTANLENGTASGGEANGDSLSEIENLRGSNFVDVFTGDDNDNVLVTAGGGDTLIGAGGDDGLLGGDDADNLSGGADNDSLNGGDGNDVIDGGDGDDQVSYEAAPAAVTVTIGDPVTTVSGGGSHRDTNVTNVEGVVGTEFNDTLTGDDRPNSFKGGLGNDTINGGDERDTVSYTDHIVDVNINVGAGSATSSDGNDTLINIENAVGGSGNDTLTGDSGRNVLSGRTGNDTIDGLAGPTSYDTVSYENREENIIVNLPEPGNSSTATVPALGETDTLRNVENAIGGLGNDTLNGNSGPNVLDGKEGADALNGGGGKDTAAYTESKAGVTADLLGTGAGGDAAGDTYNSIEDLRGTEFVDTLRGDDGVNTLLSAEGDDFLYGLGGNDFLIGGLGGDVLDGGPGTDQAAYTPSAAGVTVDLIDGGMDGDAQGDSYINIENVRGSEFGDTILGDDNPNLFVGGGGNDTLNGRGGNDALLGSAGNDIYVFDLGSGTDTVVGFASGQDRLDVSAHYSNFAEVSANMLQVGSIGVINLSGARIQLSGVNVFTLSDSDFIFSSPFALAPPARLLPPNEQYHRDNLRQHRAIRPLSARETVDLLLG